VTGRYTISPKIKRMVEANARGYAGVATFNAYSTAYCLSSTLEYILGRLAAALSNGRVCSKEISRHDTLLDVREACVQAAGALMACAEQAQRDAESARAMVETK